MHKPDPSRQVKATVCDVLPRLGLAYAVDRDRRSWGITRGSGDQPLDQLKVGAAVMLTVEQHDGFAVATRWALLN
jgi:hypothetical protein